MSQLLIVDDEPSVVYSLRKCLETEDLTVTSATTGRQGLELIATEAPDVLIVDVRLPDMSGLDVIEKVRELDPRLPVIVITAHAETDTAIEATKRGAFEYLLKPLNLNQLRDQVTRALALSRQRHVPAVFGETDLPDDRVDLIVGRSPAMQDVYKAIGRVASQDVNVLILGESGTGKELVARAIFHHSQRSHAPFLTINCAAIPESLLESEFFGHERGAFTGADRRRIGKFEQADGGTLFLDEIGDMSPSTQAKVLRLLQDQQFERLGGNEVIHTNVRLLAATNQDLETLVEQGRFRRDLYYRLKVFTITLPPLRERGDDLRLLVEHFVRRFGREMQKDVRSVSEEVTGLLRQRAWPGNVRELQGLIKHALVACSGDVLLPEHLPRESADSVPAPRSSATGSLDLNALIERLLREGQSDVYQHVHLAVDRLLLAQVLAACRGNQGRASEVLGIARNTLKARLRTLGLIRDELSQTMD